MTRAALCAPVKQITTTTIIIVFNNDNNNIVKKTMTRYEDNKRNYRLNEKINYWKLCEMAGWNTLLLQPTVAQIPFQRVPFKFSTKGICW